MATRKILPGNYCNDLSNYNDEALLIPGMTFHEYVGTATVPTEATATMQIYDRNGEKPTIPIGAKVYRLDLDVPAGITHTTATGVIMASVAAAADATSIADSAAVAIASTAATGGAVEEEVVSTTSAFYGSTANASTAKTVQLFAKAAIDAATANSSITAAAEDTRIGFRMVYTMPEVVEEGDIYKDYRARNAKSNVTYP
jgi:hypothetical protein